MLSPALTLTADTASRALAADTAALRSDTTARAVYRVLVSGAGAEKAGKPSVWESLLPTTGPGGAILQIVLGITVVALLLAVAAALLFATWQLARTFHHLKWNTPPRRLQNVEVGPQGAKFGWHTNAEQDEERDRQVVDLRQRLDILTKQHNRLAKSQRVTNNTVRILLDHLFRNGSR